MSNEIYYNLHLRRHEPGVPAVYGESQALHMTFFVSESYEDEPVEQ